MKNARYKLQLFFHENLQNDPVFVVQNNTLIQSTPCVCVCVQGINSVLCHIFTRMDRIVSLQIHFPFHRSDCYRSCGVQEEPHPKFKVFPSDNCFSSEFSLSVISSYSSSYPCKANIKFWHNLLWWVPVENTFHIGISLKSFHSYMSSYLFVCMPHSDYAIYPFVCRSCFFYHFE